MSIETDDTIRNILETTEKIAVVGCSTSPGKAAHDIPKYMQEHGYEIVPVNPFADEVLGRPAYDTLSDVPEGIDLVDVFRPSEETSEIVDAAIDRTDVDTIWLQLGITNDEAGERAKTAGKQFVQDHCLKVEHQRLM